MSVDPHRTETELRKEFQAGELPGRTPSIDIETVLRRSGRRRAPAQIALGIGVATAVVAIGVGGLTGLRELGFRGIGFASSASDSATLSESEEAAPYEAEAPDDVTGASGGGAISRAPAEKINLCGGTLAEIAPSETGLVMTTSFPEAPVGAPTVEGTVTLTNTGTTRITGTTAATPAVTLSQGGLVLWHSNGPSIMMAVEVDLEPGASVDYPASFSPVRCGTEDDLAESFRDDLPALPAGTYDASAAIDLAVADGTPVLVTGPVAPVVLG